MATMTAGQIEVTVRAIEEELNINRDPCGFIRQALTAAVTALDAYTESITAATVAAMPQPFRGASTSTQKSQVFRAVLQAREAFIL